MVLLHLPDVAESQWSGREGTGKGVRRYIQVCFPHRSPSTEVDEG